MTHSLESLLSRNPNPFAEAIALQVIRTVAEWLPIAVDDGANLEARSQLLLASHLAGLGQASGTGVGAVHAIGHALGTRGKLPHGTALAAVLPEVIATYLDVRERELALVGVALSVASPRDPPADAARAAIDGLDAFLRRVGQRSTLRELGIGPELEAVDRHRRPRRCRDRQQPPAPDRAGGGRDPGGRSGLGPAAGRDRVSAA